LSTQLATPPPLERSRKFRSWTIIIVTNLISLMCLVWVLNGAGLQHIWGEIRHLHWAWVALSIGCDAAVYLLAAWRWQLLLRPIARVRFIHAAQALYVGLFANEVRSPAGEVVRCFLISKSSDIPISVAFASALIERIFDGVWLMAGFFICLRIGHLPGVLLKGGYILGVMILILAAILGYAMYAKQQSLDLFFGMAWPRWLNTLIEDLHLIGHSRYLYFSFLVSGAYLMALMLPIYTLVVANGLGVRWTASFTMMILLRLSGIVPQAPGNLGSLWVTARTLIMFGMAAPHARRFALLLWAVLTIPLIVLGFIALALEGITLTHLHKQAAAAAQGRKNSR
jgi:glycosyltransferase 2 family protein